MAVAMGCRSWASIVIMEKDGDRYCDSCGQVIPKMSKLASKVGSQDLCLACKIRKAQDEKGLRH